MEVRRLVEDSRDDFVATWPSTGTNYHCCMIAVQVVLHRYGSTLGGP